MDIDSDLLSTLRTEIALLERRQQDLVQGIEGLDKEISGLKKPIGLAQAEVKKLEAERKDSESHNETVYLESMSLQTHAATLKDELAAYNE